MSPLHNSSKVFASTVLGLAKAVGDLLPEPFDAKNPAHELYLARILQSPVGKMLNNSLSELRGSLLVQEVRQCVLRIEPPFLDEFEQGSRRRGELCRTLDIVAQETVQVGVNCRHHHDDGCAHDVRDDSLRLSLFVVKLRMRVDEIKRALDV